MPLPILALDVDDVLNPVQDKHPGTWPDFEEHRIQLFQVWLSKAMAQAIVGLGVEIRWLTTWNEDDAANTEIGPRVGLPRLPVVAEPPPPRLSGGRRFLWKHEAMEALIAANPGRDIVWVDDDCLDICRAARGALTDTPEALYLLAPLRGVGLMPTDIEEIRTWLQSRGHKGEP